MDNELKTDSDNEVPVEAAVPIGTKLQLRASINSQSGTWVLSSMYFGVTHRP